MALCGTAQASTDNSFAREAENQLTRLLGALPNKSLDASARACFANLSSQASGGQQPLAELPYKASFDEFGYLCCLRSYVVLAGQAVWNEAPVGSGLYITFPSIPPGAVTFRDRKFLLSESTE